MNDSKRAREALGRRIHQLREYHGFSQGDVATYLGTSRSSVSLIESGNRKLDSLELKKLSTLFGLSVDEMLTDSTDINDEHKGAVQLLARATADLEREDQEEVLRFAEFLRARKKGVSKNEE